MLCLCEVAIIKIGRMKEGFEKAFMAGGRCGKFDTISPN